MTHFSLWSSWPPLEPWPCWPKPPVVMWLCNVRSRLHIFVATSVVGRSSMSAARWRMYLEGEVGGWTASCLGSASAESSWPGNLPHSWCWLVISPEVAWIKQQESTITKLLALWSASSFPHVWQRQTLHTITSKPSYLAACNLTYLVSTVGFPGGGRGRNLTASCFGTEVLEVLTGRGILLLLPDEEDRDRGSSAPQSDLDPLSEGSLSLGKRQGRFS